MVGPGTEGLAIAGAIGKVREAGCGMGQGFYRCRSELLSGPVKPFVRGFERRIRAGMTGVRRGLPLLWRGNS